jgi:hypothetical protein
VECGLWTVECGLWSLRSEDCGSVESVEHVGRWSEPTQPSDRDST